MAMQKCIIEGSRNNRLDMILDTTFERQSVLWRHEILLFAICVEPNLIFVQNVSMELQNYKKKKKKKNYFYFKRKAHCQSPGIDAA